MKTATDLAKTVEIKALIENAIDVRNSATD
jgi:hypothetical protein